MKYKGRIVSNPNVLRGKPVIKGTRISVELILGKLGNGMTIKELLEVYPNLTREDVLEIFSVLRFMRQ